MDYKTDVMTSAVKYDNNFKKWKESQTYKTKKFTAEICLQHIKDIAVKYAIQYSFDRYSEDEKRNIITEILKNFETIDLETAGNAMGFFYSSDKSGFEIKYNRFIYMLDYIHFFEEKENLLFFINELMSNIKVRFDSSILLSHFIKLRKKEVVKLLTEYKDKIFYFVSFSQFIRFYKNLDADFFINFTDTINYFFSDERYPSPCYDGNLGITIGGLEKIIDNENITQEQVKNILSHRHVMNLLGNIKLNIQKNIFKKAIVKIKNDKETFIKSLLFSRQAYYMDDLLKNECEKYINITKTIDF